jgi:hypothetical protein
MPKPGWAKCFTLPNGIQKLEWGIMTTILIVLSALAAVYVFAAISFYYGFKNWSPL